MLVERSGYINGEWVKLNGERLTSYDPVTNEVLWSAAAADEWDVHQAVRYARQAFVSWAGLPIEERKRYLDQFADILKRERNDFARIISLETGKPLWESLQEVDAMVNKVTISFQAYDDRCRIQSHPMGEATRSTYFRPHGVVAVLGPFNLPGHLPHGHIIPALLAGNTVIFKPSELTPLVGQRYMEIWDRVELPKGVIHLAPGGRHTGLAITQQDDLNGLFFTGSSQTGRAIHQAFAGRPEVILALEMGGNNPLIVTRVKDILAASYMTIQSAFITSGQRCTCARRLILVNGDRTQEFMKTLIGMTGKLRVSPFSERPEPFMGPVISKEAADNILKYQDKLIQQGGEVLLKMTCLDGRAMLTPGIIDVTPVEGREDVEIFGPLLQVIRVEDPQAAFREANNTSYGLAAAVLSDDVMVYEQFFNHSRAGIVNWNRPTTGASPMAPFGGVGMSGNHHPSAYFAADYCSYPMATISEMKLTMPEQLWPGVNLV